MSNEPDYPPPPATENVPIRNQRLPPFDQGAEEALIGALAIMPSNVGEARHRVVASDFYVPMHRAAYTALLAAWKAGVKVDVVTIADHVEDVTQREEVRSMVHKWIADVPSISSWPRYAEIVVRMAAARRVILATGENVERIYEGRDPYEVRDLLEADLSAIGRGAGHLPEDLTTARGIADLGDEVMPEWVIPGLLREGDRTILVAEEGIGKSMFTLQMAMMAAEGINPLWPDHRFAPQTTLVIDLENPQYVLRDRKRDMIRRIEAVTKGVYHDNTYVWHRTEGIDLRARATQRDLEAILMEVQPRLVVLSPLYKAFRKRGREDHEDVAAELQVILDDYRKRFGFSLLIEHHAPQGTQNLRDMRPYGSSLWLRWPEYGIALVADKNQKDRVTFGRFRNDRVRNAAWPQSIEHGQAWWWIGTWEHGNPWSIGMDF